MPIRGNGVQGGGGAMYLSAQIPSRLRCAIAVSLGGTLPDRSSPPTRVDLNRPADLSPSVSLSKNVYFGLLSRNERPRTPVARGRGSSGFGMSLFPF
jgi:hypothetical protein